MKVDLQSLRTVGVGLSRPECVLGTATGDVYASHLGAGMLHIAPSGEQHIIGAWRSANAKAWIPNGIAFHPELGTLIANMGEEGGVWQLTRSGQLNAFLREVDGRTMTAANFVLVDELDRIWISVSTRQWPISKAFFPEDVCDGYILLVDKHGVRVVADNLAFANEIRIDPDGKYVYVAETFAGQIGRFRLSPGGELGTREVFAALSPGTYPDGLAFDCEGQLWVASIISNRIVRVSLTGTPEIVLEDCDPDYLSHIDGKLKDRTLTRDDIANAPARTLRNPSSLCFGGNDRQTVYIGSLGGRSLPVFRSNVPGQEPSHWHRQPWS